MDQESRFGVKAGSQGTGRLWPRELELELELGLELELELELESSALISSPNKS